MNQQEPIVDEQAIEALIRKVRGVLAVRVVKNAQGQIDELHIVAAPERSAKQMVRDAESILYVRGGIRLDHRKISLVQVAETAIQPALMRVQLVDVVYSEQPAAMRVTLAFAGQQYEAVANPGSGPAASQFWMAGTAAARALDQVIGARGHLQLENIESQPFGVLRVCLAHLALASDDGLDALLGVSVVRDNVADAAARAVLDAANRRLQRLLGDAAPKPHP